MNIKVYGKRDCDLAMQRTLNESIYLNGDADSFTFYKETAKQVANFQNVIIYDLVPIGQNYRLKFKGTNDGTNYTLSVIL
jgi:lysophospholipase L1-like esterase